MFSIRTWLRNLFGPSNRTNRQPSIQRSSTVRLSIEVLEDRRMPSVTAHGGPVLQNVDAQALFLGSSWSTDPILSTQIGEINTFLQNITNSSYMDMLTWAGYGVSRGHAVNGEIDSAVLAGTITDQFIQGELASRFLSSAAIDKNNLYVVYVQPNVPVIAPWGTISNDPTNGFGGYNWDASFLFGSMVIHYAVIVYPGATSAPSALDPMTLRTSHELAEAVTDPEASTGNPAWEDDNPPATSGPGHQIGDIVEDLPNAAVRLPINGQSYLVQKISDQNDQPLDPNAFVPNPPMSTVCPGPDGTNFGLSPSGNLYLLRNGISELCDSGVQNIISAGASSVFDLHTNHQLFLFNSDASSWIVDSQPVQAIASAGPDSVFSLHMDHKLYLVFADETAYIVDSQPVQAIASAGPDSVFSLHTDNKLYLVFADETAYVVDSQPVQAIVSAGPDSVLALHSPSGIYDGSGFPASATFVGANGITSSTLEGVGLTLTYYAGSSASGTGSSVAPTAAGTCTVVASFAGSQDYGSASAQTTFTISQATPVVTWSIPPITYGTALSGGQLDATANVPGSFVYSPATGTVLPAGTQTLSVTFTPTDTSDYTTATQTVQLVVNQATPTLIWSNPTAITYGTALSGSQLDATANVPGSFVYTPAAGTVLPAGTQTVSVTFTPTDTSDYTTATQTVQTVVSHAKPMVSVSDGGGTYNASPFPAAATITGVNGTAVSTLEGVGLTLTYYPGNSASGAGSSVAPSAAGTYTVVASFGGSQDYTAATSAPVTFSIQHAVSNIAFLTQPFSKVTAGSNLGSVTVEVLDEIGAPIASVSVSMSSSSGSLDGSTTVITNAAGQAIFNGLSMITPGNCSLTASAAQLNLQSKKFTITPAAASQLSFVTQPPSSLVAGSVFSSIVQLVDRFGNAVATPGVSVTLHVSLGNRVVGTSTLRTNALGQAAFNNVSEKAAGTYSLAAAASSLVNTGSSIFTVTPAAASMLTFAVQPPVSVTTGNTFSPVVQLVDRYGNAVTEAGVLVSIHLSSGKLTSAATTAITNASGQAVFNLVEDTPGVYMLKASAPSLASVSSKNFTIKR